MALALFAPHHDLPHPAVDEAIVLILEEAIRAAWQILRTAPPVGLDLATANEDEINFYLCEILEDQVLNRGVVAGFDHNYFRAIISAPEVCNFSHRELKKRPDILVRLLGRPEGTKPSQDGIFIECKPVDAAHSLVSHYCNRGISRFVVGRYAWAMREALMIGYTGITQDPRPSLRTAINLRATTTLPQGAPANCPASARTNASPTVITIHRRNFKYLENGKDAPDIVLRHIWLPRR